MAELISTRRDIGLFEELPIKRWNNKGWRVKAMTMAERIPMIETKEIEFKSSLRYCLREKKPMPHIEHSAFPSFSQSARRTPSRRVLFIVSHFGKNFALQPPFRMHQFSSKILSRKIKNNAWQFCHIWYNNYRSEQHSSQTKQNMRIWRNWQTR